MEIKYIQDANGNTVLPVTSATAVINAAGNTVETSITNLQSTCTSLHNTVRGKADASTTISGYHIADAYTKGEIDNMIVGLTSNDIIVVDSVTGLPQTGNPNTIYRLQGTTSYTDNMYYNNQWITLATYDNSIDATPTKDSEHLITSGGVESYVQNVKYNEEVMLNRIFDDSFTQVGHPMYGYQNFINTESYEDTFYTVCMEILTDCIITVTCSTVYSKIPNYHVFDQNFRQTEVIPVTTNVTINAAAGNYYIISGKLGDLRISTDLFGSIRYFNCEKELENDFEKLCSITGEHLNGYYINSSGNLVKAVDWEVSDIIDITGCTQLVFTEHRSAAYYTFFDENYSFISRSNVAGVITIPANAKYIQYCGNTSSINKTGVYIRKTENHNNPLIASSFNLYEKVTPNTTSDFIRSGVWINNLRTATLNSIFNPQFSNLEQYTSFAKMPVYKNSILRISGKTGTATRNIVITDKSNKVVSIYNMNQGIYGLRIQEDGYLYASFNVLDQSSEKYDGDTYILQLANTSSDVTNSNITSNYNPREQFYMKIRDGQTIKLGILGDSTVDGMGTDGFNRPVNGHEGSLWDNTYNEGPGTIGTSDYINTNAFPYLLEQLIKSESGNLNVRVYNMGWSGKTANWAVTNISNILGDAYSDVNIVGIDFGINDSTELNQQTFIQVVNDYRNNIKSLIDYMQAAGIYVFLIKHQVVLKGMQETTKGRTLNTLNEVLDDLGRIYNIPVYDMTSFTKMFMQYSDYKYSDMFADALHGKNPIHITEAGFLMSQICERVIKISELDGNIISYEGNNIIVDDSINIDYSQPITADGFKVRVNQSNVTPNINIGDIRIINDTNVSVDLYGYINNSSNLCTATVSKIKQNDTTVSINNTGGVKITTLNPGEYAAVVITNNSTQADFCGFKIQ